MVEYKRKVVLSGNRHDLNFYLDNHQPRGIDIQCWEFDDYTKQAFTQWVCNSETPTIKERKTMEDIDRELARLHKIKVACDRVRTAPNCLDDKQVKFECDLDELNGELDKLRRTSSRPSQHGFGDITIT
jgi:hypothetical protein